MYEIIEYNNAIVCGMDEVGRGPLAGPVMAASVVMDCRFPVRLQSELRDSKKLSDSKRRAIAAVLPDYCAFAIGRAECDEIDSMNILQASFLAMRRAMETLPVRPDLAVIDGNRLPKDWQIPCRAVVGGDGKIAQIAAAAILAKVARDDVMRSLHLDYPHYGWGNNMGYGTAAHLAALREYGVTPHHRCSFRPIQQIIMNYDAS